LDMPIYRGASADDWPAVERLLSSAGLPLAGAREHLDHFVVAEQDGAIVGCAGAEIYGDAALFRSLAVGAALRGQGIGRALTARTIAALEARGVREVALLTLDAQEFFAAQGFEIVTRDRLAPALQASEEFKGACPASATAMVLRA
jgi:amino-acid N-acetyltransferase